MLAEPLSVTSSGQDPAASVCAPHPPPDAGEERHGTRLRLPRESAAPGSFRSVAARANTARTGSAGAPPAARGFASHPPVAEVSASAQLIVPGRSVHLTSAGCNPANSGSSSSSSNTAALDFLSTSSAMLAHQGAAQRQSSSGPPVEELHTPAPHLAAPRLEPGHLITFSARRADQSASEECRNLCAPKA